MTDSNVWKAKSLRVWARYTKLVESSKHSRAFSKRSVDPTHMSSRCERVTCEHVTHLCPSCKTSLVEGQGRLDGYSCWRLNIRRYKTKHTEHDQKTTHTHICIRSLPQISRSVRFYKYPCPYLISAPNVRIRSVLRLSVSDQFYKYPYLISSTNIRIRSVL